MTCECKNKELPREEETKKQLIKHLNIINGQLNGVKQMIETDRYCEDVLIQLSAISSSVKSLASKILDEHLHTCVKENILKGNDEVLDEITSLFKRF